MTAEEHTPLASYDDAPFAVQCNLTAREHRILYKLLWTAEANVMNEVFRKILSDHRIIYEVVLTEEELRCADDTITGLICKLNLTPPDRGGHGMGRGLENMGRKELPNERDVP